MRAASCSTSWRIHHQTKNRCVSRFKAQWEQDACDQWVAGSSILASFRLCLPCGRGDQHIAEQSDEVADEGREEEQDGPE